METVPSSVPTTCPITTSRFLKNTIYHLLNSSCTLLSLCPLVSVRWKPGLRAGTLSILFTLPWAKKTHRRSIRNTNEMSQSSHRGLSSHVIPSSVHGERSKWCSFRRPQICLSERNPHTLSRELLCYKMFPMPSGFGNWRAEQIGVFKAWKIPLSILGRPLLWFQKLFLEILYGVKIQNVHQFLYVSWIFSIFGCTCEWDQEKTIPLLKSSYAGFLGDKIK